MEHNPSRKKMVDYLSSDGATLSKIIATICVVFFHSYKIFSFAQVEDSAIFFLRGFRAFSACGVPVFFLLSGYFLLLKDNWEWKNNLTKKSKSLLIPYCLFIVCYAAISCAGSIVLPAFFDNFREFTAKDWVIKLIGIPFDEAPNFYGPLWFIRDLFILNVFSFLLVPIAKKVPGFILIPLMVLVFFLPLRYETRFSIPFFLIGMYFGKKKTFYIFTNPFLLVLLFGIGFTIPIVFKGDYTYRISVLVLTAFVLSASALFAKKAVVTEYAHRIIPYSFPIYLLHEYPMTAIMTLAGKAHLSLAILTVLYLIAPFVIIALCLTIAFVWKRFLPKSFYVFFGGRM